MAQAIPIIFGTTAMGFAKCSTHPTICRFVARIGEFVEPDQSDLACPTHPSRNISVFPNFSLAAWPKSLLNPPPSRPTRGALRNVTDAERDAVDADAPMDDRR
jgi:hypothetical protein